jgi:preprotein translocase subunit SecY
VALFIVALVVLVTCFVVFVERGQRKILVNYAKRQVGNKVYGGQSVAPAAQAEHVGRHPADLRLVASSCSRRPLARLVQPAGDAMRWLTRHGQRAVARPAGLHRCSTRPLIVFFCFFYTGAGVQQPRRPRTT